jgi:ABC-2 type transport system ATP-binding protein
MIAASVGGASTLRTRGKIDRGLRSVVCLRAEGLWTNTAASIERCGDLQSGAEDPAISCARLSKIYRQVQGGGFLRRRRREVAALCEVSLDVPRGQMVAYLGRNGAGKSTTIKLLTGILRPTSGEVRVLGIDPYPNRIRLLRRVGVLFGQRSQLWWDLPLRDSLTAIRQIYGVPHDRFRRNVAEFTEVLGLESLLAVPVRQLSLGQRMRGELVAALVFDPEVVFLDEPTIGLDVEAKERIRQFLVAVRRQRQITMMLTTHDLGDIEALCDRVVVLDAGAIVYDATFDKMMGDYGFMRRLSVEYERTPTVNGDALRGPHWEVLATEGSRIVVRYDRRATTVPQILSVLSECGSVTDLTVESPRVEDVLRALYLGNTGVDTGGGAL